MRKLPSITTSRAAEVAREMISLRREFYRDDEFFKMPDIWEMLGEQFSNTIKIKPYVSDETSDFKRRAAVVCFGDLVTLKVDSKLISRAKEGCQFSNFILAHELTHVALNHHAERKEVKNFQLFQGAYGMSNRPTSSEELETNYGAAFFQAGVRLGDPTITVDELARRSFSDKQYIGKAHAAFRQAAFLRDFHRVGSRYPRVVL